MFQLEVSYRLTERQSRFGLLLIGHGFFLAYIILSGIFYQERLLGYDNAVYAFKMLYQQGFNIEHGRYLAICTQWLPVLAIKLGFPLKGVLLLYSLNFGLFFYLIFCLIAHGFRQTQTAVWFTLSMSLTNFLAFYYPVGELQLSVALLGLLMAVLQASVLFGSQSWWLKSLAGGLLIVAMFRGHLLVVFPLLAVLVFLMFQNKRSDKRKSCGVLILLSLLLLAGKMAWVDSGSYEGQRLAQLLQDPQRISLFTQWPAFDFMRDYLLKTAWLGTALWFCSLVFLMYLKRWWLLSLSLLSVAGLSGMLVLVNAPHNLAINFHNYAFGLGAVMALPIVFVFYRKRVHGLSLLLLFFAVYINTDQMNRQHVFFTKRVQYINQLMQSNVTPGQRKLMLDRRHMNQTIIQTEWATALSSLLISSLEGPEHSATLFFGHSLEQFETHPAWQGRMDDPELLLGFTFDPFVFKQELLPDRYFQLPRQTYQFVTGPFDP
jgi:hypothetical protein